MKKITIKKILNKKNKSPITCLTAYSKTVAEIADKYCDIVLVGDSLGMVLYGMKSTREVTLDMMINHAKSVKKGISKSILVVDMPYQTYRNKKEALANARSLLKYTKCQSVKIETDKNNVGIVNHLKKNNINVVSHIGVTPQKFKNFNKIRAVGSLESEKLKICKLAVDLEKAGTSLIILECIKKDLAKEITKILKIPTIGIGSAVNCDGQVLVINDVLATDKSVKKLRFVKNYCKLDAIIEKAVKRYCYEVKTKKFPKKKNSY